MSLQIFCSSSLQKTRSLDVQWQASSLGLSSSATNPGAQGTLLKGAWGGQEMSPRFCTLKVAASPSTSPRRPGEEGHDVFAIAYRALRVLFWPRNTVEARRICQEACPDSYFPFVCVSRQTPFPFPVPCAMVPCTTAHAKQPRQRTGVHIIPTRKCRDAFCNGLIMTAAHLSSGQGVMDTQLQG